MIHISIKKRIISNFFLNNLYLLITSQSFCVCMCVCVYIAVCLFMLVCAYVCSCPWRTKESIRFSGIGDTDVAE